MLAKIGFYGDSEGQKRQFFFGFSMDFLKIWGQEGVKIFEVPQVGVKKFCCFFECRWDSRIEPVEYDEHTQIFVGVWVFDILQLFGKIKFGF